MANKESTQLEMVFGTDREKEVTLTLKDPRDDLTLAEVQTVMDKIITANFFLSKQGKLTEKKEAQVRVINVQKLA